jgi:hypothetical protein
MSRVTLLLFLLLSFVAKARLETLTDSLLLFKPPVKTWYVQTLEEIASDYVVKTSNHPGILAIVYSEKSPAVNDHFLVAEKQKYSWKISEIDLGFRSGIDSVYVMPFDGRQLLYLEWSHFDGVSTGEFSWNEVTRGLVLYDLSADLVCLDQVVYKQENHYGSSADETLIRGRETGFNEMGMYLINNPGQVGTEITQTKEIVLEGETLHMTLRSVDPHHEKKVIREWPEIIYRYTIKGWVRQ